VWFIHGSVPARLMRAIDLLRSALTEVLAKDTATLEQANIDSPDTSVS
jgi:hypothetical protein